jgi:hypothetical protein
MYRILNKHPMYYEPNSLLSFYVNKWPTRRKMM